MAPAGCSPDGGNLPQSFVFLEEESGDLSLEIDLTIVVVFLTGSTEVLVVTFESPSTIFVVEFVSEDEDLTVVEFDEVSVPLESVVTTVPF